MNLQETVNRINKEWIGGYTATLVETGIEIRMNGKLIAGCNNNGRTWCKEGYEEEKESLEDAINYPVA